MLEEKTTKKQNFLAGAAVLSLATMIVKVIGMFFKSQLNRLIGRGKLWLFHHGLRYLHRAAHDLHDGPARRP